MLPLLFPGGIPRKTPVMNVPVFRDQSNSAPCEVLRAQMENHIAIIFLLRDVAQDLLRVDCRPSDQAFRLSKQAGGQ
ncbi:hypothetical protein AGR8A_pTi10140 [Agrobacterium fabrum str. J-07]|nr:hypothetical protein AGR8A_pTi10140 [Agrobacterium fabrum str. J-07]